MHTGGSFSFPLLVVLLSVVVVLLSVVVVLRVVSRKTPRTEE